MTGCNELFAAAPQCNHLQQYNLSPSVYICNYRNQVNLQNICVTTHLNLLLLILLVHLASIPQVGQQKSLTNFMNGRYVMSKGNNPE